MFRKKTKTIKIIKFAATSFLVCFLLGGPFLSLAQNSIIIENPLEYEKIGDIVDNLAQKLFYIALIVAPLLILVAGIMYVLAGASPELKKKAIDMIKWTVVGFGIILFANGLVNLVLYIIGRK